MAATGSSVFNLAKNGTNFGTVTFAASGTTGTFAAASATSFAAGDVLTVTGPATADATLADIALTLDLPSGSGGGGGGGSVASQAITVTVPNPSLERYETVAIAGVTPSSRVTLSLGAHGPADENEADMIDLVAMAAVPGTGSIDVTLAFAEPTAGPINLIATIM